MQEMTAPLWHVLQAPELQGPDPDLTVPGYKEHLVEAIVRPLHLVARAAQTAKLCGSTPGCLIAGGTTPQACFDSFHARGLQLARPVGVMLIAHAEDILSLQSLTVASQ